MKKDEVNWIMKNNSLGKEKFTAGQGEIFPWAGKNKSGSWGSEKLPYIQTTHQRQIVNIFPRF